jgi:hypothetical protein
MTSLYKIATGHNNPGGLDFIINLVDANGINLAPPTSIPARGRFEPTPTGERIRGYPSSVLTLPLLDAQHKLIYDSWRGPVTVTLTLDYITFSNFNAIASLPDLANIGPRVDIGLLLGEDVGAGFTGMGYNNVPWTFTQLEAI